MSLAMAASATGGTLSGPDREFSGVSTDTRTLAEGALFIALRGDNFDGHRFIQAAMERGAAGVLSDQPAEHGVSTVRVSDTLQGLQQLAAHWRARFDIPVVGITGSNGKTTVKEMTGAILSRAGNTLVSRGNLNNHIGVPLSLLTLAPEHQYAVFEMGMNHAGELDVLTRLARPSVALINNAAAAHLEGLGDVASVACAKGEIFNGLADDGVGIINGDDAFAGYWRELLGARQVFSFGFGAGNDLGGKAVYSRDHSNLQLEYGDESLSIRLPVPGEHNARNAMAAASVARVLGIESRHVVEGLESFSAVSGRNQQLRLANGAILINDSYNANPGSVAAAIDVLARYPGRRILVLGDMAELGENATALHRDIGLKARQLGIDALLGLGSLVSAAVEEFGPGARCFNDMEALRQYAGSMIDADTVMLVKGSRSMRMERLVEYLREHGGET